MTQPTRLDTSVGETSRPLATRAERLAASRPFQWLFLVWLLAINALYYAQFRDLLLARFPALRSLWPW